MSKISIYKDLEYGDNKPILTILSSKNGVKEVRIALKDGQEMKAHKSSHPITVFVVIGQLDFGFKDERIVMEEGEFISLDANVVHDLIALEDTVVRLSIYSCKIE